MAIRCVRRKRTAFNRGRSPSAVAEWKIEDLTRASFDEQAAYIALITTVPTVEMSLLINDVKITPTDSPSLYYGTVTYKVDPIPSENAPLRWNGTTRGGTARIFRSLETVQAWSRPEDKSDPADPTVYKPVRDLNGAIEVDEENNVNGVDAVAPNEEWTLTAYLDEDLFTARYRRTLRQFSRGVVNAKKWHDFDAFEVLFLGADWDYTVEATDVTSGERQRRLVQITYYFRAGFNETDLTIGDLGAKDDAGDEIKIFKRAHDHLWLRWEESVDADTGLLTRRPSEARLERLYDALPFSKLGLAGEVNPGLPEAA